MGNESKIVSASFAFSAFAVAVVAGLCAGNSPGDVLTRAIGAMIAGQLVGMGAGVIVARIIAEHEANYRAANPIPIIPANTHRAPSAVIVVDEVVDSLGTDHKGAQHAAA